MRNVMRKSIVTGQTGIKFEMIGFKCKTCKTGFAECVYSCNDIIVKHWREWFSYMECIYSQHLFLTCGGLVSRWSRGRDWGVGWRFTGLIGDDCLDDHLRFE